MILIDSFKKLNKNLFLIVYPILFDLFALAVGLWMIGFTGEKVVSIRMILEVGIPSTGHLSNIPLFANMMEFLNYSGSMIDIAPMIVILIVIAGAFLQGGYIGHVAAIVKNKTYSISDFLKSGRKNWIQFILLEIIVFLLKIAMTAFLAIFFGIIGVFASLVFMIVLRIIFIYLEYSMVIDRIGILPAFKRSRQYLLGSMVSSLVLIVVMYAVSSSLSLLLHYYWSQSLVLVMIFVYAYLMSGIQIAFVQNLYKAKRGNRIIK